MMMGRDLFWWLVMFILFLLPEIYASKANGRSSSLGAPSTIQGKNDDIQAVNAPKMDMASLASPGNQVPFKASLPTPVLSKVKEYSNLFHIPLASDVHPSEPLAISPSQQELKEPFSITHSPLASDPPVIIPAEQGVKNPSDITPAPLSQQHSSGSAPAKHPVPLEVKPPSIVPHGPSVSHSQPPGSSPMEPREETEPPNVTNVAHSPLPSPLRPSGSSSPAISPGAQKVKEASHFIHAPSALHLHPSGVSPAISPVQKEVKDPSNNVHAPLASQSNPSRSSPVMSPAPHEVKGTPNVTEAPLGSPPDSLKSYPVTSPVPHEGRNFSNSTVAPSASQTNSSGRINQSPSSVPIPPIPHSSESSPTMSPAPHEVEIPNVTHAPKASHSHPSESPPVISPSQHEVNNHSNNAHAPLVSQPPPSGRAIQSHSSVPPIPIPRSSEVAPVMSPAPHEVEIPNVTHAPTASYPHPLKSPPVISPTSHEVNKPSNKVQAPVASYPPPPFVKKIQTPSSAPVVSITQRRRSRTGKHAGRAIQSPSSVPPIPIPRSSEVAPVMSPAPHEVEIPNVTHAPTASHPHSLKSPPVISPTSHEVNKPSNKVQAPVASYPPPPFVKNIQTPSSVPVVSITQHRRTRTGKHAHAASHPHTSVSPPVISPSLHEGKNPSNNAHAPLAFHSPPSGRIIQSPSSAPMSSNSQHGTRINIGEHAPTASRPHPLESSPVISPALHGVNNPNNAHAPLASHPPPSSGRKIQSPSSAPIVSTPQHNARIRIGNPASAPLSSPHPASHHPGRVISPAPSPPVPAVFPKNKTIRPTPPPIIQGPSHSSVHAPAHPPELFSKNNRRHHAPSNNQGPSHSPTLPPSGSFSNKQRAPFPSPLWMLPPPPPNLDCKSLACLEPLTYPPPGSLCVCILPIKVGLRLRIALFTFFPLVSEFAKEIVAGVFMKQSQVRIMGANADSEDPEKTIVIIYLVPLGGTFDINTALSVYDRFFLKQVLISASYFGDYDVLYVTYPGLPPSPPGAPENYDTAGGAFGNGNMGKRPLAVDPTKNKGKLSGSLIAIIVLSSIIALVLSIGAAWLLLLKCRARSSLPASSSQSLPPPFAKSSATGPVISRPSSTSASFSSSIAAYTGSTKTFSLAEIERATDRFHDSRIIGEGGFGRVYNALLDDRTMVAVKVLKREDQQGGREFLAEVEMLSRLHHRNLVKLVGICTEENARCLVYELIPNGSVESHLHGADKENAPLDWSARIKIALGAARGLAYLHEDSSPRVIHRDFKSSNILLEHDFTPKVSDFGLARTALDEGNQHISTRVMGTFGYVAPEYAMTGHLLVKSDVYSYGVVLLELLTGRKPVDMSQPPGQENLVSWALPLLTSIEGLKVIIDPTLGTDIPSDSIAKVAAIASMCVQPEVSHRPFMSEVVQALKLVSNEGDEYKSESGTEAGSSTKGSDIRIHTGVGLEEERVLSESDIFCTSARFTTDASGSFRRHASSGPLETGRSGRLGQRVINFSSGSMREAGAARRSGTGFEGSEQWP